MTDVLIIGDTFRCPELRHEVRSACPTRSSTSSATAPGTSTSRSMEVDRIRGLAPDLTRAPARGDRDRRALRAGPRLARDAARVGGAGVRARRARPARRAAHVPGRPPRPPARDGVELDGRPGGLRRAPAGQGGRRARRDPARAARRRGGPRGGSSRCCARRRTATACSGSTASRSPSSASRRRCAQRFAEHGCTAEEFIVAPGPQGAAGHEMGHGPIRVRRAGRRSTSGRATTRRPASPT